MNFKKKDTPEQWAGLRGGEKISHAALRQLPFRDEDIPREGTGHHALPTAFLKILPGVLFGLRLPDGPPHGAAPGKHGFKEALKLPPFPLSVVRLCPLNQQRLRTA